MGLGIGSILEAKNIIDYLCAQVTLLVTMGKESLCIPRIFQKDDC